MGNEKHQPYVLGINASHNGAACLMRGDEIRVAIQEERLNRKKGQRIYGADDALCINYCLQHEGIQAEELEMIVLCPQKRGDRVAHDIHLNPILRPGHYGTKLRKISHHYAHAVSVFATSGFSEALILIADGVGSAEEDLSLKEKEVILNPIPNGQETISLYYAEGTTITPLEKQMCGADQWLERIAWQGKATPYMPAFQSLGGMYSAAAVQIFGDMDNAGKVMGLAPFGQSTIPVDHFLNLQNGIIRFNTQVCQQFQHAARWPQQKETYQHLAASVQQALEHALFYLLEKLKRYKNCPNLCMAGGIALNSVANQKIIEQSGFKNCYIIPATDDSGIAIGAAWDGVWSMNNRNTLRQLKTDGLGAAYSNQQIEQAIQQLPGLKYYKSKDVIDEASDLLAEGKIIGWFQGRSELGPRALGQRSILCDPKQPGAKEALNAKVKFRELFRPFAPSILFEEIENWFDLNGTALESPFMLRIARWKDAVVDQIPAVVHVDLTGRIQTVKKENGLYYELIRAFYQKTGVPILLNTSFNVMGEPIVETPTNALWGLLLTGMDACILGEYIVTKQDDFSSILDFIPQILPTTFKVAYEKGSRSVKNIHFEMDTPWGKTAKKLPGHFYPLIQGIDGKATGHELLDRLNHSEEENRYDEQCIMQRFRQLIQHSFITFRRS